MSDGWVDMYDPGDEHRPENVVLVCEAEYAYQIERDCLAHMVHKIMSNDARLIFDFFVGRRFWLGSVMVRALPEEMPDHLRFLARR